ncbi:cellulose biosynthesis protein BcsN [Rhizobium sp. BK418]|uniref:cellulose biosynthesis protein BcsN n=1 Tax=Rhizobium sp. BK418 TaxID=2512120 RepID=UPI00104B2604|nr:cellulose biosynthesis protein BcsN [Rhizobium sp. BK418]TCS08352.1 cellulose biosynthesis protein BcsN [Rhizobium sp. BK418]
MHFLKTISLVAVAAMMTGCTSTGGVRRPAGPETVEPEKALVLPPPGGPSIVSVVERKRGNGVEQTISLFTSSSVQGQNFLKAQFLGATGANPGAGNDTYRMIREGDIAREMARSVPGVPMATSATFLQNSYGPFGYASGRSRAGDTCVYAWQQIRSSQSAHTQARNFGMIQIRLRLCDARATERQLLGIVYGYTVTGTFDGDIWNPYGAPPPANPTLGQTGAPIYPDEGGYRPNTMPIGYEPAPAVVRQQRTVAVRRVQPYAAAGAPVSQAPVGPHVPLPNDDTQTNAIERSSEAPAMIQQTARPIGVTVPSPDCIGDAAMTADCRE